MKNLKRGLIISLTIVISIFFYKISQHADADVEVKSHPQISTFSTNPDDTVWQWGEFTKKTWEGYGRNPSTVTCSEMLEAISEDMFNGNDSASVLNAFAKDVFKDENVIVRVYRRCSGKTQQGTRCKRLCSGKYCWQHK